MKALPLFGAFFTAVSLARADDAIDRLEAARLKELARQADTINAIYACKYKTLLQQAKLKGDTAASFRLRALISALQEPETSRQAKKRLVENPCEFTAPQTVHKASHICHEDGTWGRKGEKMGNWKIENGRLLVLRNGKEREGKVTTFVLPIDPRGWKGVGGLGEPVVLKIERPLTSRP